MSITMTLFMLLANPPQAEATPPRYRDTEPARQSEARTESADPLFDRAQVATDDPAFVLSAVEGARQSIADADAAAEWLHSPELRSAAQRISAQNKATARNLEQVAQARGWRLPQANTGRQSSLAASGSARANADFIIHQIAVHQNVVDQYRAQLTGNGDGQLKNAVRQALPGYEKNLELLLELKP